ncbi:hypothetical protein [Sulfurovum sp.]|uniref:hypothetical protein n=1 Tax=Sulfurovum sp. TaxID=1969726 RepID=UPI0028681166|nr:hypothetical protein [Sulfurovum sp.]
MGTKKFLSNIQSYLGLKDNKKMSKKKALKDLLKKLNVRKLSIMKSLEGSLVKKEKKELKEDLDIISLQIQKGEKLLNDLSSEK